MSRESARVHPFVRDLCAYVVRTAVLETDSRILVALSGGPDSCALILALLEAADSHLLPHPVGAAHFHHGLRGSDADADAAYAAALCARWGVPMVVGLGVAGSAPGQSPNDAARRARYAFLEEAAHDLRADCVVTAHTADDQAETVLGRVLRGAGVDGLSGIPPRRAIGASLAVARPLLSQTRVAVEEYCAYRGITPRHDPSNDRERYTRSRLRKLLPDLARAFNPRLPHALSRLAEQAARDSDLLRSLAHALWRDAVETDGTTVRISCDALLAAHPALRGRVLLRALREGAPDSIAAEESATAAFVARLDAVVRGEASTVDLPGGRRAWRDGATLLLAAPTAPLEPFAPYQASLPVPGDVHLPLIGLRLTARARIAGIPTHRERRSLCIDIAYTGSGRLIVRSSRPDDRMSPLGMSGKTRAVRDILRDAGWPASQREHAAVVACGDTGEILWIVGVCQAESTRVEVGTSVVVALEAVWEVRRSG